MFSSHCAMLMDLNVAVTMYRCLVILLSWVVHLSLTKMSTISTSTMLTTEPKPLDHVSALALCITQLDRLYKKQNQTTPTEALGDYLGLGYDILTGESKMVIFDDYYNNCNVSADGKYILPDFFRAEKIHSGSVDKSTVIYTSMKEYTESSNSDSGGSGGGAKKGFSLAGSFSHSSQSTKSSMEKKNEAMILFKAQILLYRLQGDLSGRFGRAFSERIKAVVDAMKRELRKTTRYLIEEIYRDYGNHVILQADLGVKLERKVFVSSSLVTASSEKASNLKMGVEATMKKEGKEGSGRAGFSRETMESIKSEINQVDRTDIVSVWGGPNYEDMFSNDIAELLSTDNVVALSKDIVPLHSVMHIGALSGLELTESQIGDLRIRFQNVYDELIERNTYRGCTDKEFYNFDFQANENDKTCNGPKCKIIDINFPCEINQELCHVKRDEMLTQLSMLEAKAMAKEITVPSEQMYDRYRALAEHTNIRSITECTPFRKTTNDPSMNFAKFFALANMAEFKSCAKKGTIVYNATGFYLKVCDVPTPAEWTKPPQFGGFYQECELDIGTQKYYNELKKLGKPRESPCERLTVRNFVTNELKCPGGLEKVLIKQYIHTMPDSFESVVDGLCDYANGHGCETYAFDFVLKDKINISTYWCNGSALYYGGAFERSRPYNSYINAEGCGPGMTDVRIFHETVLCVSNVTTESRKHDKMPELRFMFSVRENIRRHCLGGASKKLLTVITDMDEIYACIFKKSGYAQIGSVRPAELPFKDFLEMLEAHEHSILTTYKMGNESHKKTIPLYTIDYKIVDFIKRTVATNVSEHAALSENKEIQPKNSIFTNFTNPIIISIMALTVLALILLWLCC